MLEARDAANKHPTMHRTESTTKNYLLENVNNTVRLVNTDLTPIHGYDLP